MEYRQYFLVRALQVQSTLFVLNRIDKTETVENAAAIIHSIVALQSRGPRLQTQGDEPRWDFLTF